MPPTYRAAIIGTGRIASRLEKDPLRPRPCTHAGSYAAHPRVQLIAGADTDPGALAEFGADWKLSPERLHADYRSLLQNERPDIVSVAAYAPERAEMCLAALDAGAKGLWIEKAVATSLADAARIETAAGQAGAVGVVDYPRRARAPFRAVKRLIDDATFGRLQSVTCHMTHQLIHTGTHAFDVLRYWCGEALSVTGKLEQGIPSIDDIQDQGGSGVIEMGSGTTAFISAYRKRYYIFQFDLVFDSARILLGNDIQKVYLPGESRLYSGFKELFEQPYELSDPHQENLLQDLVDSMDRKAEPLCSIRNAVEALRIGLALFESHRQGARPISPAAVPADFRVQSV